MNAKTISKVAVAVFLAVGAVGLAASGCGTSSGSFCAKICDCTGCSEEERGECVDTVDDTQKAANDEGCNDQYNSYFSCVDGELTCNSGTVEADGCDAEVEALDKCMKNGFVGIGVDVCKAYGDKLTAKFEGCGFNVEPGSGNAECTAADAALIKCYWKCIEPVSCDVLNGNEYDPDYVDCVQACQN